MSRPETNRLFNRRSPVSFESQPGRHHFPLPSGHHHPVEPGIDENPLAEIRSTGPDLDRLVTQEDQLSPGLSDAEGTHLGFNHLPGRSAIAGRLSR